MTQQSQFFLPDRLIEHALDIQLECCRSALAAYDRIPVRQRTPDERQAMASLKRDLKAYERAGEYWAAGLRPNVLDGVWSIGSLSEPGRVHHIRKDNGRWACDCWRADGPFHVHQAIMTLVEVAMDLADQYEGYDVAAEPPTLDDPPPTLPEPAPAGPSDTTTTTTTPICFSNGVPLPDEPDWQAEEDVSEPWLPGLVVARPYRPAPMPRVPYAQPRSSWQQRQNDEALRPWRSEERARLEQLRERRAA